MESGLEGLEGLVEASDAVDDLESEDENEVHTLLMAPGRLVMVDD